MGTMGFGLDITVVELSFPITLDFIRVLLLLLLSMSLLTAPFITLAISVGPVSEMRMNETIHRRSNLPALFDHSSIQGREF